SPVVASAMTVPVSDVGHSGDARGPAPAPTSDLVRTPATVWPDAASPDGRQPEETKMTRDRQRTALTALLCLALAAPTTGPVAAMPVQTGGRDGEPTAAACRALGFTLPEERFAAP